MDNGGLSWYLKVKTMLKDPDQYLTGLACSLSRFNWDNERGAREVGRINKEIAG